MNLSERQKRLLQWLGYPLLALVVFIFAVQLTFPYERVKERLIDVLREKYEVSIVSVEPTFLPGGIILETVVLQSRPSKADEEPTTVLIDELRVDVGLLGLLLGHADVDITAAIGGGSIDGNVVVSSDELEIAFATEGLPLETLPGLRGAVGLPMKGGLDASVDLRLPEQRWDQAEGTISLACSGCTVGDGQAKIKPRSPSRSRRGALFASQGMTVPELRLGTMTGKISISEGQGTIEQLTASSADGDLVINGAIQFGRAFKDSEFERGCMKFRLSDELKQREPNFGNLPMLIGVALQEDGYANLLMKGKLVTMKWLPATSCEEDGSGERLSFRRSGSSRPSISGRLQPAEPTEDSQDRGEREGEELEPEEGVASPPPNFDRGDNARGEFPPPITPVPRPADARGERSGEDDVRLRVNEDGEPILPPGVRRNPSDDDGRREEIERSRHLEDDDDGEEDEAAHRGEWEEDEGRYEEDEEQTLEEEGEFE